MPDYNNDQRKTLLTLLNRLNDSITEDQKRFYYLRTIENMIFHFNEIKDETDRSWVYQSLSEYLNKCFELLPKSIAESRKDLYDRYLYKLISYYHDYLGFPIIVFSNFLLVVYLSILIICSYFFKLWVVLLIGLLFLIQTMNSIKRYRNKRFYETSK
jgi:hypothetical protein